MTANPEGKFLLADVREAETQRLNRLVGELSSEIDRYQRKIDRIRAAREALNAKLTPLEALREAADDWHAGTSRQERVDLFSGEIKVWSTDIGEVRKELSRVKADVRKTLHASRSTAELTAIIDQEVARLRQAGTPNLGYVIAGAENNIYWPSTHAQVQVSGLSGASAAVRAAGVLRLPDVPATLAWLFPREVKVALHKELQSQLGEEGLGAEERAARLKVLRAELLAIERLEEHIIETQQPETPRRRDLDLRAFLNLPDDAVVAEQDDD